MSLDPQVKAFLDDLAAQQAPPLSTLSLEEARAGVAADAAVVGEPEPVERIEDRCVPGPGGEIPVRIYTPHRGGPLPVLVYYHGGGWVLGDIPTHETFATALANAADCIVVSVAYRLAPEHKYPAAVDDAYAAAAWVFARARDFGADPGGSPSAATAPAGTWRPWWP